MGADFGARQYVVVGILGSAAYLLMATLSAFFIAAVPQARDWCRDFYERVDQDDQVVSTCVSFKNDFEERKYHHNLEMLSRNKTLLWLNIGIWSIVGFVVFHLVPTWKGLPTVGALGAAGIGATTALLVPIALSWILPAPVEWFPDVLREIHDAQVDAALRRLR